MMTWDTSVLSHLWVLVLDPLIRENKSTPRPHVPRPGGFSFPDSAAHELGTPGHSPPVFTSSLEPRVILQMCSEQDAAPGSPCLDVMGYFRPGTQGHLGRLSIVLTLYLQPMTLMSFLDELLAKPTLPRSSPRRALPYPSLRL